MANNEVKIILSAVNNASKQIDGVSKSFQQLTGFSLGSVVSLAAVGTAFRAVEKFAAESVKETVAYNKTIREMTQVTGLGAEEISRIVQVGDDWGVNIDAIRTSLAFMNKTGVTPSIDNLAKLADEYVSTTDKSAFAEKAVKLLGRGYQTLIPLLALGGDGFRKAAAGIDKSLIATDKAIDASRDFEVITDKLNDTWTGLTHTIGNKAIPVLNDLLGKVDAVTSKAVAEDDAWEQLKKAEEAGLITKGELVKIYFELSSGSKTYTELLNDYGIELEKLQGIQDYSGQIEREEIIRRQEAIKTLDGYTDATNRSALAIIELNKAAMGKEAIDALNKAYEAGIISETDYRFKMTDLMGSMLDMSAQSILTTLDMADLKKQLDDGNMSAAEYANAVRDLYNNLMALDGTSATTTIVQNITTHHTGEPYVGGASGLNFVVPPGYPNDSYPINVESGEHVVVTPAGGNTNNTTNNSFNMSIHTNAPYSTLMGEYTRMKAMAG